LDVIAEGEEKEEKCGQEGEQRAQTQACQAPAITGRMCLRLAFTRYEVHEKLQNFMVPVPMSEGWHEEQIDELFASLVGNGMEAVAVNVDPQVAEVEAQPATAVASLFRVFG
jgi:Apoptosis-antagonizing transcription factor, C-terminal